MQILEAVRQRVTGMSFEALWMSLLFTLLIGVVVILLGSLIYMALEAGKILGLFGVLGFMAVWLLVYQAVKNDLL